MVVKCIDDKGYVGIHKGNLYKVNKVKDNTYGIIKDNGCFQYVDKNKFKKKNRLYDLFI